MRLLFNTTLLLITVLLLSTGCRKDIEGPRLKVSPNETQFSRPAGQWMEFGIDASADDGLKSLRITKKENNQITQTVLDTVLSGTKANFTYPFLVPAQGVSMVNFVFTLEDMEGRKVSTPRKMVIQGAALLQETAVGVHLYSIHAGSDKNRFFSIVEGVASQEPDSVNIDVMDYDEIDDDILSRQWTSGNGLQFARFDADGFDYPQATFTSAKNSFAGANKTSIVSNISEGDKIIVKYSEEPERYAVFDIIEIFDEEGSIYDRYRFNMKK